MEKFVPPEPTLTRAAWGPSPARMPRAEALTCTPGMLEEKLVPPEPTFTRADRGPSPTRIPRVEALMRTPGMIRILRPMGILWSFSPRLRSGRDFMAPGCFELPDLPLFAQMPRNVFSKPLCTTSYNIQLHLGFPASWRMLCSGSRHNIFL